MELQLGSGNEGALVAQRIYALGADKFPAEVPLLQAAHTPNPNPIPNPNPDPSPNPSPSPNPNPSPSPDQVDHADRSFDCIAPGHRHALVPGAG